MNVSVASVYGKILSMRIGGVRRYSRAVIQEILEKGSVPEPSPRPTPVHHERHRPATPAKVVSRNSRAREPEPETERKRPLTIREVAKMLRLSPYKVSQLVEAKKIHYIEFGNGKKYFRPDAVEYYIAGGTARQFVEKVIADAESDPRFRDDPDAVARFAAEWREEWPE